MYYLKRHFSFSSGHRLSKHRGLCKNFHGHNYDVWITIRSEHLNKDDMVMDFGDLKAIMQPFIDAFDHCLLINETDESEMELFKNWDIKVLSFEFDPTAERLAKEIFVNLEKIIMMTYPGVEVDQIEVFENARSSAIFRGD